MVSGDSNRLQQVFWNLLSNAIKFTPSGGTVRVDLSQKDSAVVITVSDTGSGIDPEFLPFVFDRFRQADSTTTRRHGGLGLGLAIARHLVEIHGGSISAESCGKDQGSKFTVSLPLIAPVSAIPERGEASGTRRLSEAGRCLSGLHILVVDDDEDTLELVQAALARYHARVTAVTSAGEALATLELAKPDVLISDIGMPGTDGYELIKRIRSFGVSTSRTLPAVAITAYAKDEDRDRALASGYHRYLAKPIELEELITAVADALKGEAIAGT
jgi:CheY-like chemotaxis protein